MFYFHPNLGNKIFQTGLKPPTRIYMWTNSVPGVQRFHAVGALCGVLSVRRERFAGEGLILPPVGEGWGTAISFTTTMDFTHGPEASNQKTIQNRPFRTPGWHPQRANEKKKIDGLCFCREASEGSTQRHPEATCHKLLWFRSIQRIIRLYTILANKWKLQSQQKDGGCVKEMILLLCWHLTCLSKISSKMRFWYVLDRDAQYVGCDIWHISRQWCDDRWASSSCHYHAPLDATRAAPVEDVFGQLLPGGGVLFGWFWQVRNDWGLDQPWVFVAFLEALENLELLT